MVDFINESERLYNNIKKHEMELPTGELAHRLLKNAEISKDKQQLARATLTSFSWRSSAWRGSWKPFMTILVKRVVHFCWK